MDHSLGYEKLGHNLKFKKVEMEDNDDLEYVKVEKIDAAFGIINLGDDVEFEYEKVEKAEMIDDDGLEHENVDDDLENETVDEDEYEDEDESMEYYEKVDVKYSSPSHLKLSKDMEIEELVKDRVLPFLPAKALARFKSVSKEWDRWIKSPFLGHQQSYYFKGLSGFFCQYRGDHTFVTLDNSVYGVPSPSCLSFLPEEVKLLSSCNGLLLCRGLDPLDPYYVCNPATQEWTYLPSPKLYHDSKSVAVLAFEPSALNMGADYQLLCLVPVYGHVYFELYSSKTGSWKVSDTILVDMENSTITCNCFYMKGIAYLETSNRKVIAFDLSAELYEFISLNNLTTLGGVLTQIKGELSYIGISRSMQNGCFVKNGYTIRIYTGMNLSIQRQMNVTIGPEELDIFPEYRVLPCLDGDNVMLLIGNIIYSYNMHDQSVQMVASVSNISATLAEYLPYVNSLVQVAMHFDH